MNTSGDLYAWEENDPKDMAWEYEDELADACEEGMRRESERLQQLIRNTGKNGISLCSTLP